MRILVTGATGTLGRRLLQQLRRGNDCQIKILVRTEDIDKSEFADIEQVNGDLSRIDSLIRATKGIDTIIHLAAITHTHKTDLYDEVNRCGTENLIQAAEYSGVRRFIFISSKTASSNGGAYAKSKFLAEEGLIKSKCDWVILRPAEVYGVGSNGSIEKIINLVKKGYYLPIVGNGDYTLAPVFVDDVVNGIVSTIDNCKATRKVFVLEGPKEYTFIELVEVLENRFKRKIHKVYLPVFIAKILALFLYILKSEILYRDQIPRLLCRKTKGHSSSFDDLGIKPRSLEDEIETICHT